MGRYWRKTQRKLYLVAGIVLIVVGSILLLNLFVEIHVSKYALPIMLIVGGILFLFLIPQKQGKEYHSYKKQKKKKNQKKKNKFL